MIYKVTYKIQIHIYYFKINKFLEKIYHNIRKTKKTSINECHIIVPHNISLIEIYCFDISFIEKFNT